jgi:hypothetical protein
MQARVVSAASGARWLAEGWRIFRAAPLGWFALSFAYLLLTNVLALIPILGVAAALLLVPPLTVGMMGAARAASRGAQVQLAMLAEGFRTEWRAQLALGAVYLAGSMLIFAAVSWADENGALRSILSGAEPSAELELDDLFAPLAVFALLYTPMLLMFWFAPPLAAWHATGVTKALFFSFFGCLMNWRAFLAYGVATALVVVVFPFVALSALRVVSGGNLKISAISLVFPLLIVLLPTLFASFYASYRDVFASPHE